MMTTNKDQTLDNESDIYCLLPADLELLPDKDYLSGTNKSEVIKCNGSNYKRVWTPLTFILFLIHVIWRRQKNLAQKM